MTQDFRKGMKTREIRSLVNAELSDEGLREAVEEVSHRGRWGPEEDKQNGEVLTVTLTTPDKTEGED